MAAKLDPRLGQAISSASRGDVLGATVVLTPDTTASDETFEKAVAQVVRTAAGRAAASATRVTAYPALRTIAIDASADLLRELVKNPVVESASLVSPDEDVLIRPVSTERVTLEEGMRRQERARKPKDKPGRKTKGP
jgi:hypothetical protein